MQVAAPSLVRKTDCVIHFRVLNSFQVNSTSAIVETNFQQDSAMIAQLIRFCIVSSFICLTVVQADVLKMPGEAPQIFSDNNSPVRGMTKNQVESKFGAPHSKIGPVGEPAIYRWDYARYSVFFENNYVLHSVVFTDK